MNIEQIVKAKNIISDINNIKYLIDYLKRDVCSNSNVSYEHKENMDKRILNFVGFENIVKYFNKQFDKYKRQIENITINNMSNEEKKKKLYCVVLITIAIFCIMTISLKIIMKKYYTYLQIIMILIILLIIIQKNGLLMY